MQPKIITLVLLSLLITACGTTPLSNTDVSDFKSGKKSIIRTNNNSIAAEIIVPKKPITRIRAVDGKPLKTDILKLNDKIVVDTGLHQIEFSCADRAAKHDEDFTETIPLYLKPHHEYVVHCWLESGFVVKEKLLMINIE